MTQITRMIYSGNKTGNNHLKMYECLSGKQLFFIFSIRELLREIHSQCVQNRRELDILWILRLNGDDNMIYRQVLELQKGKSVAKST